MRSPCLRHRRLIHAAAEFRAGSAHAKNVLILFAGRAVLADSQTLACASRRPRRGADGGLRHGPLRRGRGRLQLWRVPYNTDHGGAGARAALSTSFLVGAKPPVGFFAHPGKPSKQYPPQAQLHARPRWSRTARRRVAGAGGRTGAGMAADPDVGPRPRSMTGAPTPEGLAQTLAAVMPEHASSPTKACPTVAALPSTHAAPGTIGCIWSAAPLARACRWRPRSHRRRR